VDHNDQQHDNEVAVEWRGSPRPPAEAEGFSCTPQDCFAGSWAMLMKGLLDSVHEVYDGRMIGGRVVDADRLFDNMFPGHLRLDLIRDEAHYGYSNVRGKPYEAGDVIAISNPDVEDKLWRVENVVLQAPAASAAELNDARVTAFGMLGKDTYGEVTKRMGEMKMRDDVVVPTLPHEMHHGRLSPDVVARRAEEALP
jgi:hypothetical protein